MENISNDIEAEIVELNRQLAEKKKMLEARSGVVEEKEALTEVVSEHIYGSINSAVTDDDDDDDETSNPQTKVVTPPSKTTDQPASSYLDTLSPEEITKINTYILGVPAVGIKKTINQVKNEEPLLIDAFHDALVTKLYDELKSRGFIK